MSKILPHFGAAIKFLSCHANSNWSKVLTQFNKALM